MGNFTPLKIKKKKTNSFLILANLFLLVIIVGVTGFYLKDKLLTNQQKAASTPGTCQRSGNCVQLPDGERGTAYYYFCPNMTSSSGFGNGCQENVEVIQDVNQVCFRKNCGTEQVDFVDGCFGSRVADDKCGSNEPTVPPRRTPTPTIRATPTPTRRATPTPTRRATPTPTRRATPTPTRRATPTPTRRATATPTPTPILTLTETPTATPTLAISSSPTPTSVLSSTPTNTPGPTSTPGGPTATPTEIIIAQISPTTVANLLETSTIKSFVYIIPVLIMLIGLIL